MDFDMLGLAPRLIAALKEQGITDPTPIQAQAIPLVISGSDIMGLAQTGTGKTLAFACRSDPRQAVTQPGPGAAQGRGRVWCWPRPANWPAVVPWRFEAYGAGASACASRMVCGGAKIGPQIRKLERGVLRAHRHPRPPDRPDRAARCWP